MCAEYFVVSSEVVDEHTSVYSQQMCASASIKISKSWNENTFRIRSRRDDFFFLTGIYSAACLDTTKLCTQTISKVLTPANENRSALRVGCKANFCNFVANF